MKKIVAFHKILVCQTIHVSKILFLFNVYLGRSAQNQSSGFGALKNKNTLKAK